MYLNRMMLQEAGEYCIMWSIIICALRHILLEWSNQGFSKNISFKVNNGKLCHNVGMTTSYPLFYFI